MLGKRTHAAGVLLAAVVVELTVNVILSPKAAALQQQLSIEEFPALTPEQIEADWLESDRLRFQEPLEGKGVRPEDDAAGGCDGVKNGKWGFHTENEPNPWWQVDLQDVTELGRIVLYNRCDSTASRARFICVLLSEDGNNWRQVYKHNGTVFYGYTDGKPCIIELQGQRARYVRLQIPGTSYFHLDEVEIYPAGSRNNIALGKPATQSSTSQWSVRHKQQGKKQSYEIERTIDRGRKLAQSLKQLGLNVERWTRVLDQLEQSWRNQQHVLSPQQERELYFRVRWTVRRMALANPLLNFDKILFVKRVPPAFPHMSDQYYGWWIRPGGGIYVLEGFKTDKPRVRCLTADWPPGSFLRPDISYDGTRVLFAYARYYPHVHGVKNKVDKANLPEDAFYHIFEMNLHTGEVRQLTRGKYNDFDARYLPCGDIVFLSTRKGQAIQVSKAFTEATLFADLPESYVRCGGDNWRPVPVFTLHRMTPDGKHIWPISAFENFEWTPSISSDGTVLYARWDYIDRFNGPFISLWATNPDGTNARLVYGNYTVRPQCVFEARSIPGSDRLIFTAAAHHSNMGGSLVLLDRSLGTEFDRPIERLTPEVCFPETEGWPNHYYANPYPLSEDFYLVAWSNKPLPRHHYCVDERNPANPTGIYLLDRFGNLELLYRDPEIGSWYPIPLRSRPRPPILADKASWQEQQTGTFLLTDVYRGLPNVKRGTIKRLRIVAVPPKVQPQMNNPVLGVSKEDPGKFVLGTVPVEADGSAMFRVPSGLPVFFQALDEHGMAIQTMRSLTYVMPGEVLTCVGCHESRDTAPPGKQLPMAAVRAPSALRPGPTGSWPLDYRVLVQPVLDRLCVHCHNPQASDIRARQIDLTSARSYETLIGYANDDLKKLAFEQDRSIPGNCPARRSKLMALLMQNHYDIHLTDEDRERIVTWMDTYAHRQGYFSQEQAEKLRQLRKQWDFLFR